MRNTYYSQTRHFAQKERKMIKAMLNNLTSGTILITGDNYEIR